VTGSQEMYGEAAERGPVVLCLESVDLAAASEGVIGDVGEVRLDPKTPLRFVDGAVLARFRALGRPAGPWPYRSEPTASSEPGPAIKVPLIPYHEWAERGPSTMRVWLPVDA
jgi:DUF1680 family protein